MKYLSLLIMTSLLIVTAFACPGINHDLRIPGMTLEERERDIMARSHCPGFPEITKNYDVRHYGFDLTINNTAHSISGYCDVKLRATESLSSVTLLLKGLTIDSITVSGVSKTYTRDAEKLTINLGQTYTTGQDFILRITYHGTPDGGVTWFTENAGSAGSFPASYTITEPDESRYWFPCYDHPSDKADEGVSMVLHVPSGYEGVSQGTLVSHVGDTWTWNCQYPISTYLISFTACQHETVSFAYETMPITVWAYPGRTTQAAATCANTSDIMSFFSTQFGEYPFVAEKYDMTITNLGGGMEHQTATTMGTFLQSGGNQDWIIAHEMAHQWFGDSLTCGDWRDIWLNEGFATYCDALWTENKSGKVAFQEQMLDNAQSYFQEDIEIGRFPIYDPTYMWGGTVYEKGSWILHMLRKVMGETSWWSMVKDYHQTYSYQTVLTPQLQAIAELHYGDTLNWFFDEWVYQAGYPVLALSYSNLGPGPNTMDVRLTQVQTGIQTPAIFKTPIDIRLVTSEGYEDHTVWLTDWRGVYHFTASAPVTNVILDPNHWLLFKQQIGVGVDVTDIAVKRAPTVADVCWEVGAGSSVSFDVYRIPFTKTAMTSYTNNKTRELHKLNEQPITGQTSFTYHDTGLAAEQSYQYFVVAHDATGNSQSFGPVLAAAPSKLGSFSLEAPRPNPARSSVSFTGMADARLSARISIFDVSGRLVTAHEVATGNNSWSWNWDLKDASGNSVASGVYAVVASCGNNKLTKRVVVAH